MSSGIVIFFQHIVREYETCLRLRDALTSKCSNAVDVRIYSIDFQWEEACRFSKACSVVAVVFPWMRLKHHETFARPFVDSNPNVSFYNLNHEQIGSSLTMPVLLPQTEFAKKSINHFAWSDFFKEALVGCGVPAEKISVCGNARIEALNNCSFSREKLARMYDLNPEKEWVLFAESRSPKALLGDGYKKDQAECSVSDEDAYENYRFQQDSLDAFGRQLNGLSTEITDRYEFIYRLHPGQELEYDVDSRIKVISELPIGEWLHAVQLYLTWGSTSAFEASILGVPVLIHDPTGPGVRFKAAGLNEFLSIVNLEDILSQTVINSAMAITEKKPYERYMGKSDTNAIDVISEVIVRNLNESKQLLVQPGWDSKVAVRKRSFEKATRIVCSMHLLNVIKYPRSAYRERADIPFIAENLRAYKE